MSSFEHSGACLYGNSAGPGDPISGHRDCIWELLDVDPENACLAACKLDYRDTVKRILDERPGDSQFSVLNAFQSPGVLEELLSRPQYTISVNDIINAIPTISEKAFDVVLRYYAPTDDKITNIAAKLGRIDLLPILDKTTKGAVNPRTYLEVVRGDPISIHALRYLTVRKIEPRMWVQILELSTSSIDAMKFFIKHGKQYNDERFILRAMHIKKYENIRFLIDNGVHMSWHAAKLAAETMPGHIIKAMYIAGCFFGEDAAKAAVDKDNSEGLTAVLMASPIDVIKLYNYAKSKNATKCIEIFLKKYPRLST